MALTFYNTLTRKTEKLVPLKRGIVSMYHCGPTVYDRAHIGNLRSYVFADTLRRTLENYKYEVRQVMNITDVDDKTIKRSREENVPLKTLAKRYEELFFKDLLKLNVKIPEFTPRATEHIKEMVAMIEKLLSKGVAYKSDDGVYFSIGAFKGYGALAGISHKGETRSRVKNDEYDKDNPKDFALWKFHSEEDGSVAWDAPFGRGRPGWHIECSAMSIKYLGEHFDIHTGGTDLIFPHHTNEIAQSEAATGKTFVSLWMHNNHILIDGEKMSKSLGNAYTLDDILFHGVSPVGYRYWLLTAHYRTLANFTWEAVSGAENAFEKLKLLFSELPAGGKTDIAYKAEFDSFLNNDLDTPKAIALLWELLKDREILPEHKRATILYFDNILGLNLAGLKKEGIPDEIMELSGKREEARKNKDFARADVLRQKMDSLGYAVLDGENGPVIRKKRL
ncbi:MAG: cysteine--tRNA ligase [Patescibacteria group bacterium]